MLQFGDFHVFAKRKKDRFVKMSENADCFQQKHEFNRQPIVNIYVRIAFKKILWNLFDQQMFRLFFQLQKLLEKNLGSFLKFYDLKLFEFFEGLPFEKAAYQSARS